MEFGFACELVHNTIFQIVNFDFLLSDVSISYTSYIFSLVKLRISLWEWFLCTVENQNVQQQEIRINNPGPVV